MKTLALLIITVFFISCHSSKKTNKTEEIKCADLIIIEISQPDWVRDKTVIKVTIKNIGEAPSIKVKAKMYDLDISISEAKKLGLKDEKLRLIEENVSRAKYYNKDDYYQKTERLRKDLTENDYDKYIEDFLTVSPLDPGEEIDVFFIVEDYWIYDSNCEIEVILDVDNILEECDEENNIDQFFGWG